jgi:hypothetical protein
MGLRALRGSRLEIRCYIEGFMILKTRRGVAFSNVVVPMLRLVWRGAISAQVGLKGVLRTAWSRFVAGKESASRPFIDLSCRLLLFPRRIGSMDCCNAWITESG